MAGLGKIAVVFPYIAHYRRPVFKELISRLKAGGAEIDIYCGDTAEVPGLNLLMPNGAEPHSDLGVRLNRVHNIWLGRHFLFQRRMHPVLSGGYDSVIFLGNMYYISTWLAALWLRLRGSKVYFWTHGFREDERGIKGFIRDRFYQLADGILLFGQRGRAIMARRGHAAEKLHVIYNSLDYNEHLKIADRLSETERAGEAANTCASIIAVGRLTPDKRIDLLIDAVGQLVQRGSADVSLSIVGDGPERGVIERRIAELGLEAAVTMHGACYDEVEVARMLRGAKVACIPGDIGLFGIHAMTFGIPVVTHNNLNSQKPEVEVIEDGVTGTLYESGSVTALADALMQWIDRSSDSAHRADIQAACRSRVVMHFTPMAQAQAIIDALGLTQCGHSCARSAE